MSPPATIARRVWIARAICIGVMDSMSNHPLNGSALKRQRAAGSQKVFNQLRHSIPAMGKQAMETHANAEAAGYPVQNNGGDQGRPAPKKQRGDGRYVSYQQEDCVFPIPSGCPVLDSQ
jgi:hypothetical protein